YLEYIDLADQDDISLLKIVHDIKEESHQYDLIKLLKLYQSKNQRSESLTSAFMRNIKFKSFLNEFLSDKNLDPNEKVLVFTHNNYIRLATSELVNDTLSDYPEDGYIPNNLDIFSINIHK